MALEGTLKDMSLNDLFQIFHMGEKSGILILSREHERGIVFVRTGRLIDAMIVTPRDRLVRLSGEPAVIHMLHWSDASFIFNAEAIVTHRPVVIQRQSSWLVLEALRQSSALIARQPLTLETTVQPGPIANSTELGMGLDLDQWRILEHVTASITLRSLAQVTCLPPATVLQLVTELVATGLLQVVLPPLPYRPSRQAASIHRGDEPDMHGMSRSQGRINNHLLYAIQRRIRGL